MRANSRAVLAAADKLEPELALAFRRSVEKLKERTATNALAMALSARDVKRALLIVTHDVGLKLSLTSAGKSIEAAVLRGGQLAGVGIR